MTRADDLFPAEPCPDCGAELRFGPCACVVDAPPKTPFTSLQHGRVKSKRRAGMREMVHKKLVREGKR